MNFVIDEQLPPALAEWIELRGHSARHLQELGLLQAKDHVIWTFCSAPPAVIVTKDEDFVIRRARSVDGPQVLSIRLGNAANDVLIAWLAPRWGEAVRALESGAPLVELR